MSARLPAVPDVAVVAVPEPAVPDWDLSDDDLRRAGSVKWTYRPAPVLPAWVAEMDVAPCPPVLAALRQGLADGAFGYPAFDAINGVPEATAGFLARRFGWQIDPDLVVSTGDVMAGVRLVLENLCAPGPVVVPLPTYPPFLQVVPLAGRELTLVEMLTGDDGQRALDLGAIEAALRMGARTVLLASPHNPTGRVFTTAELTALRDLVLRFGARVISDEIHAPLVLPEAESPEVRGPAGPLGPFVPYASLPGTAEHVTTVTSASKTWNTPGLRSAQIIAGTAADATVLRSERAFAGNHGVASLGLRATVAAYQHGEAWLDALLIDLADRRRRFGELLAAALPELRWAPMQATYLAWVDARSTGLADPAAVALRDGQVFVQAGRMFDPTGDHDGFMRVNLATSAERLERIVAGLATALG